MKIRLPEKLRGLIEAASQRNKRSMNAEIVARLEDTFTEAYASPEVLARAEAASEYVRQHPNESEDVTISKLFMRELIARLDAIEIAVDLRSPGKK